jgi:HPt (histidine-containing phosphotransfer) domain-containing protein
VTDEAERNGVSVEGNALVDRAAFAAARAELGTGFVRILGYFREDGVKSVAAIETAMRKGEAAALVLPAHTLKGEARQFGALPLAALAETIEMIARGCVERQDTPDEALQSVARLRPLFHDTLTLLERESTPAMPLRRPAAAFGRRTLPAG